MNHQAGTRTAWHPLLRFAVGVVAISVIRVVIGTLPVLQELVLPGFNVTALDLARITLGAILLAIAFQCGRELAGILLAAFPGFPELSRMVNYLVLYGTAVGAYRTFLPLATVFFVDLLLIYQLTFLIVAGVPLVLLIITLLQNLAKLAVLIADAFRHALHVPAVERCPFCGAFFHPGDRYCPGCGTQREKVGGQ